MRPLDPRLIRRIGPARRYILVTAGLGFLTALLILVQALLIARLLAPVLSPAPLSDDGLRWWGWLVAEPARELAVGLAWLGAVVAARTAVAWLQERLAHRAGVRVISEMREMVVAHVAGLGPRWNASGRTADVVTLVTRGLDDLLPYFVRYLPQLALAVTVTPVMIVVVLGLDWLSAVIVVATLPLVPLFMVLVGLLTRERSARHLEAMQRLGTRTLDLIEGIPTLKALGRERGPAERVRRLGDAQRKATMGSLRIAFLSGMVLELLTTLAVAIVAVTMGFRLIHGDIGVETALAVLVLAPEVYLPVRNVGTHFHASADGLAAADAAFALVDDADPAGARRSLGAAPALTGATVRVSSLDVLTPDGARLAPARLTFEARPGKVTALRGPNGEGKSTALLAITGLLRPDGGTVAVGGVDVLTDDAAVELNGWLAQVAWVPQRPDLGVEGRTLSLGMRQRVALSRAFDSGRPLVLLDEPTAHLDRGARAEVIDRIRALADRGATVVVATHEDEVLAAADAVVDVVGAAVASEEAS
ncbi:ABC transporter transmembrane domain-containing protein [Demequina sp. SYSU T00039]|uniref:ABC transporter transmembrane domain-containing protein n=1 Tax=Demequina lignilytica TaxID=3051663 RepID=A0AAW7M7M1_9MICO|nr:MULTISPECIES: ABC transporter transmembrane domain-containing protein [unclassified Demequina]MDN4478363.1 ABC transporter transmembrane domain-containing protein [Demequina sp. SYSU T00039-1]MDN4487130.1 ABC transporter transmembrane domain-containing protein [Demequina sp. SYSU T00039]MDN4489841.1 ABC transporter transmembrane domain-containing protein [Demequina sp. SYSU T00068]